MPKRAPAKLRTTDDFVNWVKDQLPDLANLNAHGHWWHTRHGGTVQTSYHLHIDLIGPPPERKRLSKESHDLAELARWFLNEALPEFQPKPEPRPNRKLTVERLKLTHQPAEPLFR